jgi:translation initiation factor IF-1
MAKQPSIEQDGVITEALSNAMFRVDNSPHFGKDANALYKDTSGR